MNENLERKSEIFDKNDISIIFLEINILQGPFLLTEKTLSPILILFKSQELDL